MHTQKISIVTEILKIHVARGSLTARSSARAPGAHEDGLGLFRALGDVVQFLLGFVELGHCGF